MILSSSFNSIATAKKSLSSHWVKDNTYDDQCCSPEKKVELLEHKKLKEEYKEEVAKESVLMDILRILEKESAKLKSFNERCRLAKKLKEKF
ncbi:hypothetical protein HDU92_002983 [Lobulomyces angularis]|nr:hypothetical protein HDU92_002983 [Lobulomyces angularis]